MVTCFAQQLPHIQLELLEDTTQSLLELLGRGQLDLLLLALPIPTPGCRQRIIGRDPFHLVTHVDSLKHLDERVTLDNLPNAKVFLLQQEHCLTEHAISACSLENHSQVSHFYASSLHSLVQMCCVKEGVTFLPNMALKKGILADYPLTALPAEPHAFREIGLVWRNSTTRIQLFHYIASMLTDLVPEPIS
jgi:LysR family hydrogen peroxide-inducible transcriptional activator